MLGISSTFSSSVLTMVLEALAHCKGQEIGLESEEGPSSGLSSALLQSSQHTSSFQGKRAAATCLGWVSVQMEARYSLDEPSRLVPTLHPSAQCFMLLSPRSSRSEKEAPNKRGLHLSPWLSLTASQLPEVEMKTAFASKRP